MRDIINDLAHFLMAFGVLGLGIVGANIGLPWGPGLGFVGGLLIGLLAEAKEDSPQVFAADLKTFRLRDILGYAAGGAVIVGIA